MRALCLLAILPLASCQAGFFGSTGQSASGARADALSAHGDQPSVAVVRRLSNVAYNNAVKDLLGTTLTPADSFVADDLTNGFDTVGATLQVSPTSVLGYLTAAEALAAEATQQSATPGPGFAQCAPQESDDACVQRVLGALAPRAWRRPLQDDELVQLLSAARSGSDTSVSGRLYQGIVLILMSPHFLFQVELDAEPASQTVTPLTDYELAARLAMFLWSSIPDSTLTALAANGTLHDDPVLAAEIDRMLDDPRSQSLISHFASFWLGLTRAEVFVADPRVYPDFNSTIRQAMLTETRLFLHDYILGDAPIARMLDSNTTYLNAQLAAYYGLAKPEAEGWAQTVLPSDGTAARRGLLTQGAMLIAYSDPSSTNLIRRGKNVLTSLLCVQIGPPPAGAGTLPAASTEPNQTQRQRLEAHIINPSCAACHGLMDPIGYAFERFGPDARERSEDNGSPIDASGMYGGESFTGAYEFVGLLAKNSAVNRCAAKSLYTYALGVAPTSADNLAIGHLTSDYVATGGVLRSLVKNLAMANVFRTRRAQGSAP